MSGVIQTFNNLSYSKKRLEDGRVKLSIEIANDKFEVAKEVVYARLAPTVKISGFRPGKAPRNVIEAQLGPTLYEETLGKLLPECTLEIIKRENLMPLDQIAYKVEKVASGEGVKYSAVFTTFPDVKLPDLSKIKVEKKEVVVKDDEVEKVLEQMASDQQKTPPLSTPDKTTPSKGSKEKGKVKIDDSWAASLNLGVKNLKELKEKVKGELERQKQAVEQNRYIGEILKKISQQSKFEIPAKILEQEVTRREAQYRARIENLGMKVEDFLRNQKTTMDELKKGWMEEAREAVQSEIILMQIAGEYNIKVEQKEVDEQISAIKDEKLRSQYQGVQGKRYISGVLLRQKVIKKILELVG
jgi:trigger factor